MKLKQEKLKISQLIKNYNNWFINEKELQI